MGRTHSSFPGKYCVCVSVGHRLTGKKKNTSSVYSSKVMMMDLVLHGEKFQKKKKKKNPINQNVGSLQIFINLKQYFVSPVVLRI